ncbi:MAG: Coenzyme F420 hydrogenase/dehydrogenase, beta subunit C-terminal domain [Pseudomonadota bacterium]
MPESFQNLKADVVDKGLCTGCGTCVGVCPHHCLSMQKERGEPEPALTDTCPGCNICYAVCPGKDIPLRELEQYAFGTTRSQPPRDIGVYRFFGQGHATSKEVRWSGASGGLVSALIIYALDSGLVDGALLTGFDDRNPYFTKPCLVTSSKRVLEFAQSKYAMVSVNELLGEAFQSGIKKLAVVGCPCHIEGIRKLQMNNLRPSIAKMITLMIGLFCGSQFYFEGTRHVLAEECGVNNLHDIRSLQYRGGEWPGGLIVDKVDGGRLEVERHHYIYHILLPGWRRDRCMMCLDWSSELSDLSVGDHFAAPAEGETPLGESAFITRSELGEKIIKDAEKHDYIKTRPLEIEFILGSPGFELKKHSAGYRWRQRRLYGWPTPDYQYEPNFQPIIKKTHFAPEKKK